ncbi:glycerol:H+ symporter [Coccidioides immitis RS]|uniref:Glycerol:H+ symporter n=1 Tax=Coccidioides immitis (strain RS) TaxID=246410 RepID=J3KIB9_COCIM|nr:glycerol:H+ symporter [Coccidioides immitis RS]EAS35700.3 glycerol:H+ symporter [Coccidioides immitis RS]TPX26077.1 glycerol transporter [Coccidioides immitis]
MSLLSWLRRLYSLDTLDPRFTASANQNRPFAGGTRNGGGAKPAKNGVSPSRWNTPEFYIYYVVFIIAVPMMFKTAIDVSQESHPTYSNYSELLAPGWIPGRKVDNSDLQYASFRDNIRYMALLIIIHPLLRRLYNHFFPSKLANSPSPNKAGVAVGHPSATAAQSRFEKRVSFDYWFALIFLVALHGFSSLKVLGILLINYNIATNLPRPYIPAATWIFNIGILFANELLHGYKYARIAASIASMLGLGVDADISSWGEWLDSLGGIVSRWEVLFNITVLRLISFNLDYYWSLDYRAGSPLEKKQLDPSALSERDRIYTPADPLCFNVRNYLSYTLYSPLYLAGPIITFNDYIHQQKYQPPSISKTRTLLYGVRFLLTLLSMELILHYIYVVAISKSSPDWSIYTPFQLSMLGYFNLHIIWLKLLIPWRFFRLWALIDGIDPPENMVRCMSDNYSALAFWRSWHRSFNRWVVRYLYVPLGGSRSERSDKPFVSKVRGVINFLVVFTFVALWHDINLRLLMWGWLITLFVLPEILASLLFPEHKWRTRPNTYRVLCGVGAVANILMMMAANLVGFALGLDGLQGLLSGILGSYAGLAYLAGACAAVFVGVQVMFEIREEEFRAGIRLKC